jgi:hypothetical protein
LQNLPDPAEVLMNSTLTPVGAAAGPATETRVPTPAALPAAEHGVRAVKRIEAALLAIAAVFFALHFVHLRADFPNRSPWMDWAKYTDEGWYDDAAIRHYQLGHWYVPGDFNPAVALPVWPAIESVLFRFTGVSLVAARALTVIVFGLIMACCYLLIRRWPSVRLGGSDGEDVAHPRSLAPALAVLLLAVSPFCFALMRLAILEPLLVLLSLAALLVASATGPVAACAWGAEAFAMGGSAERSRLRRRAVAWAAAGADAAADRPHQDHRHLCLPSDFFLLWAAAGYRLRPSLLCCADLRCHGRRAVGRIFPASSSARIPHRLPLSLQRERLHRHHFGHLLVGAAGCDLRRHVDRRDPLRAGAAGGVAARW